MDNLVYVIFFIIYVVFSILKKAGEKKAIERNKTDPSSPPQPKPKGIFERLEEIKKIQEQAARELQEKMEPSPSPRPQPVPLKSPPVPEIKEKKMHETVSYDQVQSLELNTIEALSLENFPESVGMDMTYIVEESIESESEETWSLFDFNFENPQNLQQAFLLKEILDSPVALQKKIRR